MYKENIIELYNADCLEKMKDIPDNSIDLILTDPPYQTTSCHWDNIIPFDLMWLQLKRIMNPKGTIVLFGVEPFSSLLRTSNLEMFKYDWYWKKNRVGGFVNAKLKPMRCIEIASVFSYCKTSNGNENNMKYFPQGLVNIGNRKNSIRGDLGKENSYSRPSNHKNVYIQENSKYPLELLQIDTIHNVFQEHPTQKPVELMSYLIKTYTNENDTVLDFTMGSGTTGVSCVETNRNFIGIELEQKYFDIAVKRINEAKENKLIKDSVSLESFFE